MFFFRLDDDDNFYDDDDDLHKFSWWYADWFFFANLHTHPRYVKLNFFLFVFISMKQKFLGHTLLETVYHLFFFSEKNYSIHLHIIIVIMSKKKVVIFFLCPIIDSTTTKKWKKIVERQQQQKYEISPQNLPKQRQKPNYNWLMMMMIWLTDWMFFKWLM